MFMLVGCRHNKYHQSVISKNKQHWNQELKNTTTKKEPSFGMMDYNNDPLTWQQFKAKNDLIILGTVVDYEKNRNQNIFPTTKVQVRIDKVLFGKKMNKYITTTFPSGFGYANEIELIDKTINEEYFYQKNSFPLPKIGSKFVTGMNLLHGKYQVSSPLFNFWVLKNDRLKLNNLDLNDIKNDEKVSQLLDLTDLLNCKLNIGKNR